MIYLLYYCGLCIGNTIVRFECEFLKYDNFLEICHAEERGISKMFYSFLFVQKRTKKGHPKMMTAHFRGGAMIYLLCCCDLCISNTIVRLMAVCIIGASNAHVYAKSNNCIRHRTRFLAKLRKVRNDKLLKYNIFLEICHAEERGILKMFYSFLFVQKRTKKGHPKMKTAHFREEGLIKLSYYCDLCFSNFIVRFNGDFLMLMLLLVLCTS